LKKYGLTPNGPEIPQLADILNELHDEISEGWKVNTRHNPHSYFNVQLTSFADKIVSLWQLGEQIYHAMYPNSAENADLDNAVQYGGITREEAKKTIYPVHCTCLDGTLIPRGTVIRSDTNPALDFTAQRDILADRHNFNIALVRILSVQPGALYTVVINGELFSFMDPAAATSEDIVDGLSKVIDLPNFSTSTEDDFLKIVANDLETSNILTLSSNMTTESITSVINFLSPDFGEVVLPTGTINQIITGITGLLEVENRLPHIAGRYKETDPQLRRSYQDKIYLRSSNMVESIESAIWQNVQGVRSVRGFQNDTHLWDAFGRPPHSVEMVVDGGSSQEIALQIWNEKAAGIQSPFGNTEAIVTGKENEPVIIRFSRPELVYVWWRVELTLDPSQILPPNYVQAIQDVIAEKMATLRPGNNVSSQRLFINAIHEKVPGIAYVAAEYFATTDRNEAPIDYKMGLIEITPRQLAVTEVARIEVVI